MSIIPAQPYLENPGLLKEDLSSLDDSIKSGGRLLQSGAYKLGNAIKANPKEAGLVATGLLGGYALSNSNPLLVGATGLGGGYLLTKIIQARKGNFSNEKNTANFINKLELNFNDFDPYDISPSKNEILINRINAEREITRTYDTNRTNLEVARINAKKELDIANTPQLIRTETITNGGQPGIGQQIAKVLTPRNIGIGAAGLLAVGGGLLAGKTYLDYKAQQDKNKRDIELEKLYRN